MIRRALARWLYALLRPGIEAEINTRAVIAARLAADETLLAAYRNDAILLDHLVANDQALLAFVQKSFGEIERALGLRRDLLRGDDAAPDIPSPPHASTTKH